MKNYLDGFVMDSLKEVSMQIGMPNTKVTNISTWNCGGGCEGLSTPII